MRQRQKDLATKQRLLDAAGALFADRGFRNTNVRDICRRAGANVAAVNYHFRDKEGLYAAVFQYAGACAAPEVEAEERGKKPEQRLRLFIRGLLVRFFDGGRPAWLMKLVALEMIEPTRLLDTLVEERIRPDVSRLKAIVRELTGGRLNDASVTVCAFSIVGQCTFYRHNRSVVARLCPGQTFGAGDIERLADHITAFSLGALASLKRRRVTRRPE
ncbi:MAG TPA: CerR family C-terminal domain-containing protein [Nitrospiria bacterium]|nr:CerR family C-terminal domain-containing protein [Nitrospiria bacterium]